ncbi:MAG: WD40 repeat domain-containing protein [Proteobacteria bacterium]|nr:WD40 repeat domain-containing protein [Pseudomonadota bacterium]MCP4915559.1 WD40 repeat domain-containing protein [Pseudomonadota bacterium]
MPSLVDQFCPNVHDAAITAAACDPDSGVRATGDAAGVVAVTRRGESTPGLVFQPGGPVTGAIGVIRGGSLVAVGDDNGTVGVYRSDNGQPVFQELREGARGRVRAMRGIALSPSGRHVASIAVDGLIRLWDLETGKRDVAWQGFGGLTVAFDARGDRLLCVDAQGQPRLIDLRNREGLPMDRLQMPATHAYFTRDGTYVVCAGGAGISLLRVVDGVLCTSFATRGGSGISSIALSPDGRQVAAVTQRSVHTFDLPELTPAGSLQHGAPSPSGAGFWAPDGIRVAGSDGLMHGGGDKGVPPVVGAAGFGSWRVAAHVDRLALWNDDSRLLVFPSKTKLDEALVDRDGRLIVTRPERGPIGVYSSRDGRLLFDGGPETSGSPDVAVGGSVVCAQLKTGGIRWWELSGNRAFELAWPKAMALSGSGTWLGVVTPKGAVRILDPKTGQDAVAPPRPLADVGVFRLAFVNRRPDLLILDNDGVLGHYDLGKSAREGVPGEGRDVLDFNVAVDRLWGITGGQYCALRLPEGDTSTILVVDLHACDVVHEITGLSPKTWVDPESGRLLEPARSGAILEREMDGTERRVLRSLPGDQWLSFSGRGIQGASDGAGGAIS